MKQIKYRDLLRNPRLVFPIPASGIEIVRQQGNFYILSDKSMSDNKPSEKSDTTLSDKPGESVSDKPDDILSDKPSLGTCQLQSVSWDKSCSEPAIDTAKWNDGEQDREANLCEKHYKAFERTQGY